jgi:hypothetical protein
VCDSISNWSEDNILKAPVLVSLSLPHTGEGGWEN